jgi:hypothetical protein
VELAQPVDPGAGKVRGEQPLSRLLRRLLGETRRSAALQVLSDQNVGGDQIFLGEA